MIDGSGRGHAPGRDGSQGPVSRETRPGAGEAAADAARLGIDLSAAAAERLVRYERLLLDRAVPVGLVAASDAPRVRERHVMDSLRAVAILHPDDAAVIDVGSGAGLPGIVVAIARPDVAVVLVEPRRARAAFLELAVEALDLPNARVVPTRIEEVDDVVDVCLSRAFAPLPEAWAAATPHLRPGGRLVFFAGTGVDLRPIATSLPGVSSVEVVVDPSLESAGPLVIMAR